MKKVICMAIALCALFLISAVAESGFALDPKRINEAAESVVILEQKDEEGNVIARASGFAALEPGLVITSASFIEDAGEIIAISDAGETLSVSGILGCNTDCDVAIIALTEKDKLAPLSIDAEKRVLRGSDCVVVGAQGENISVSIGNMSGFFEEDDVSLIQFTAPLSVGSGGSPLFDENGNVAGVTTGSYYDGTGVVQNLNFAVNISEALSLYEIVKEDEIAAFSEWEITDIGIKSFLNPEPPMEFYIENNTKYDVSRIYFYKRGGYAKKVRVSGPKRGETVTVPITQEEYEGNDLWVMMFEMPSRGGSEFYTLPYSIPYLMGRTFELKNLTTPNSNWPSMELMPKEKYLFKRRHMPEDPALLARDDIPYNCIKIINDTDMTMVGFKILNIYSYTSTRLGHPPHPLYPGYSMTQFLTDKEISETDIFNVNFDFYSSSGIPYTPIWEFKKEDILGHAIRLYLNESGELLYELQ